MRIIDSLAKMDEDTFVAAGRSWNMVLSDGSHISIKVDDDGNPRPLEYEDREEYAERVRDIRMGECDKQVSLSNWLPSRKWSWDWHVLLFLKQEHL